MDPSVRVSIPDSEMWAIESAAGGEYQVMVSHPVGAPPSGGYPTIVLLDANATFGTVTEAVRLRARRPDVTGVVPSVLVGVGYPTPQPYDRRRRTFDFTAGPPVESTPADGASYEGAETGGAGAFLRLLVDDILPRVAQTCPIDPSNRALVGHSLGGYFVLRTLLESPGSFRSYVAGSPSIWWDRQGLFDRIPSLASRLEPQSERLRVMVTVGEYEEKLSPAEVGHEGATVVEQRRATRAMVTNARELAERLESLSDPRVIVAFEEFSGEDHASTVLRTINACLRFVLADALRG